MKKFLTSQTINAPKKVTMNHPTASGEVSVTSIVYISQTMLGAHDAVACRQEFLGS